MKLIWTLVAAVSLMAFAAPARAQGVGGRVGASVDPDQFYFGAHFDYLFDKHVNRLQYIERLKTGYHKRLSVIFRDKFIRSGSDDSAHMAWTNKTIQY